MVAEQVSDAMKEAEGRLERQYGRVRQGISGASESVKEYSERAGQMAQSAWEQTLDSVRENPAKSIGIALAAGLAIGLAIGFSRRD